jgi:tetratricopeptide (TPR) repeat protein
VPRAQAERTIALPFEKEHTATGEAKLPANDGSRRIDHKKTATGPEDWETLFQLGLLELEKFHNFSGARSFFARACELNPTEGSLWFQLGLTVFRMGYFEESEAFLRHAQQCGFKSERVWDHRGDALYNLGRFDEACKCYSRVLEVAPENSSTEAKLSLAMVCSGKVEQGLARLRAALTTKPHVAELHEGLVLSLVFVNRIEEAAEAAESKLHAIGNSMVGDYLRSASLWAQLRQWRRAINTLQQGLLLFPGDPELRWALEEAIQVPTG